MTTLDQALKRAPMDMSDEELADAITLLSSLRDRVTVRIDRLMIERQDRAEVAMMRVMCRQKNLSPDQMLVLTALPSDLP